MAHAVANATNWTAKTPEHLRKVLTQCNCEYHFTAVQLHNAIIVLRVSSTIAWVNIFLGCWRDSPFLNRTHLVFAEIIPMGGQEAPRPDSDEDCIRIGEFLLQPLCRALGQTEASFQFWKVLVRPGRDSNHAELRPTIYQTRSERSNPWVFNLGYMYCWGSICLSQGVHLLHSRNKLTLET